MCVCVCVRACVCVCSSFAAKKYAELFGKEKKEKKAKEPKKAADATPKKEKKEKKPVVKEEEEEEEEEEKPRPPAFKDPYLELPKRCVYMCAGVACLDVGMFVCVRLAVQCTRFQCGTSSLCRLVAACTVTTTDRLYGTYYVGVRI